MKLVIAEKTKLKDKIAAGLDFTEKNSDKDYVCPGDFLISGLEGHVKDAYEPHEYEERWKDRTFKHLPVNPDQLCYRPAIEEYRLSKYEHIKKLIPLATEIYHAGDPDREGQAIVDNILDEYNLKIPVKRVWLNNLSDIKAAFENPALNSENKYVCLKMAAKARTFADWLIGMNYSRAINSIFKANGYNVNISIGRIQTPALKLVVDRYRAVKDFKKKYHYDLTADFEADGAIFSTELVFDEAVKPFLDEDGQLVDKSIVEAINQEITQGTPIVSSYSVTTKKEKAPLPHTTAKIIAETVRKFGYSVEQVANLLQSLYENGAIDYPRTDYEYLSEDAYIQKAPGKLEQLKALPQFANTKPDYNIKSRAWDNSKLKAHEGITPISTKYLSQASAEEINVFHLLAVRFLMQFYPDYTFDQTVVNIKVGKYKFSAKSNTVKDAGWKELASTDDEETNEQSASLPKLAVEQHVKLHDSKINNKETKPPKLFTEDTLLTAMCNIANYVDDIIAEYESITGQQYCDNVEEFKKILRLKPEEGGQLGTGATQPVVIQTIQERAFVCKDEKDRLLPTQLGLMIIDFFRQKEIIKDYSFLINPLTSASYEKQLSAIQYGELSYDKFIATFKAETIEGKVLALEQYSHLLPKNDEAIACPTCKIGFLFQKRFRDKKTQEIKEYFGCSRSPDCNAFYSIVDGKPNLNASQKTEFKCPQCETGYLIKRTSKNAKTEKEFDWYFCSNYKPRDNQPECSAKYYDENGKPQFEQRKKAEVRPTGEKCPKCKDGNIVIREAFSEKHQKTFEFKGCDQYPKCEYIVKEKRKKETKPFSLVDKLKTMAQL